MQPSPTVSDGVCDRNSAGAAVTPAADDATKEETLKAWEYWVGTWQTTGPDGQKSQYTCEKTKFGSYLFHNDEISLIVGWDSSNNRCKSVGFDQEAEINDTWILVGDGPRFEGYRKDGTTLSKQVLGPNRYILMIGDEKTIGQRIR